MAQNNTLIYATLEDKIIVQLDGKPTTGHVWTNYYLEGNALLQDGEPYYIRNHTNPGAPGIYSFPYIAHALGDSRVRLVEGRSWEDTPLSIFYVSFTVKPSH